MNREARPLSTFRRYDSGDQTELVYRLETQAWRSCMRSRFGNHRLRADLMRHHDAVAHDEAQNIAASIWRNYGCGSLIVVFGDENLDSSFFEPGACETYKGRIEIMREFNVHGYVSRTHLIHELAHAVVQNLFEDEGDNLGHGPRFVSVMVQLQDRWGFANRAVWIDAMWSMGGERPLCAPLSMPPQRLFASTSEFKKVELFPPLVAALSPPNVIEARHLPSEERTLLFLTEGYHWGLPIGSVPPPGPGRTALVKGEFALIAFWWDAQHSRLTRCPVFALTGECPHTEPVLLHWLDPRPFFTR